MHPPLDRPHPKCGHLVKALVRCHEENKYYKFLGACNDVKIAMDKCFKEEKEEKRKANSEQAKLFHEKVAAKEKRQYAH